MRIEKAKGIETSMVNQTKQALEASLKHLLLQKPLDKITISDLTKDCGISRMAFYYHFKDIYDLVEWSCLEDATRALAGKKTYSTWTEGLLQIFEVVYENKPFIMNAYRCISREQIENFLFQLTSDLIMGVVKEQEQAANTTIPDKDKRFIADFYKYSFVGIMLDWIKQGMKEDYGEIARMIAITLHGGIANSIIIIGSAVYRYMNGFNSATNVKDYQLQLSCIILCYICYVMSIKHLNESDGAMTDSIKADLNRVITTVEQVKQASNSILCMASRSFENLLQKTHTEPGSLHEACSKSKKIIFT